MTPDQMILDTWAPFSHKAALNGAAPSRGPGPMSWVGRDNQRRLTAYSICDAYRKNVSRWYITASSEEVRDIRREYGDPDLFTRQVAASVLGRGAYIAVEGADDEDAGPARTRQDEIDKWVTDERADLKLLKAEQDCLALGDVVWWLTYSEKKKRVRLRTLDPGFYFPVYPEEGDTEDYPPKVHLAWEFQRRDGPNGQMRKYVRRITYELLPVAPYSVAYQDEEATEACHMTDATWLESDLNLDMRNYGPDGFNPTRAVYAVNEVGQEIRDLNLGIDFIPLVHVPNLGGEPWGTSIFSATSHILDDLQMADTDAAEAADVAGGPPILVAGASVDDDLKVYGPKTVWRVPTGGGASVLDTSKGLDSLHNHKDHLFKRLTYVARVPREILGAIGAAEVPSGTALALAFNPFKVLISELRLSRKHKQELLLKMVQRLMVAFEQWSGPVLPAAIEFGSALPEDLNGLVNMAVALTGGDKPLISRRTLLVGLHEAGFPALDDPAEEMDLLHSEDFAAAESINTATGSPELAAEHLGLNIPQSALDRLDAQQSMGLSDTVTGNESTSNASRAGTGTSDPGANRNGGTSADQPNQGNGPAPARQRGARRGRRRNG